MCSNCGKNPTHNSDRCYVLKRLARNAENAGNGKNGDKKPYSKRTFRKEVNAMARRAAKNDGLDAFASALKREQGKQVKYAKKKLANLNKNVARKPAASSSDSSSEEEAHNLEARIPRKSALKKVIPAQVLYSDSDSEDENEEVMNDIKPSPEEKAFLVAVNKEEKKKRVSKKKSSPISDPMIE